MINTEKVPIGAKLKELRLAKKLTLEEVYRKTKIPVRILEAIEEGRPVNINPVYINGFIKIYCSLLGINPDEYTRQYRKVVAVEAGTQKGPYLFLPSKIKISLFGRRLLNPKIIIVIIIFFVLVFAFAKMKKTAKRQPHKPEVKKVAVLEKAAEPEKPATKVITSTPAVPKINVGIHAKEDCWIKATVDNKVIFQSILKKGRFESWQAHEKIELSLGNAGGIELELNGKPISPLGRRGQSVKKILINSDGLKVIK